MQHDKDIKNFSEIEKYTTNESILISTYERVLKSFNLWGINRMLAGVKERGVSPISLFQTLIVLPFLRIENVYNLFLSGIQDQVVGSKNAFYRFMNNEWIPWRKVLYAFARQFVKRTNERCDETTSSPKCLILDDTRLSKTGKKIEHIGKVHDHSGAQKYALGFKALLCGFWDGKSFLPLDFSLHHEPGTKGNHGMKKEELAARYTKDRSPYSEGYVRETELSEKKNIIGVQMVKNARQNGFSCDYVLTDSWFLSEKFIKNIRSLPGKGNIPHVLGIFVSKRNVVLNGRTYSLRDLPEIKRSKQRRCKSLKCMYIPLKVTYKDIPVKVFLVRMKGHQKWKVLLTTNQSISFIKAMKTYAIRWSIEVCFKDMKQHLQLGKSQSLDFDAQIAATTISCIHYIILAFAKRHDEYETLGGIFEQLKETLLKEHLLTRLWKLLKTIYSEILAPLGVCFDDFMHRIIHSPKIRECLENTLQLVDSSKIENPPPKLDI